MEVEAVVETVVETVILVIVILTTKCRHVSHYVCRIYSVIVTCQDIHATLEQHPKAGGFLLL